MSQNNKSKMMKNLMLYFFVTILSCSNIKNKPKDLIVMESQGLYEISKIDSVNSYYFIYAIKNSQIHKIISNKVYRKNKFKKIKVGEFYTFELINFPNYSDDKNPLTGFSSIDPCFMLDEVTEICNEEGVVGLYKTDNLEGLYYLKK
jgi:CRISPR/Cas system Type II protein with McrA/HNH and RuvC-like nuclease domain